MNIRFASLALLLATLGTSACVIDGDGSSSLTIDNQSDFVIEELYITEDYSDDWGPNLLDEPMFPDDLVTVELDCEVYDALLIDETGVECEIFDLDLCFDDDIWVIRNNTCTVFEVEAKRRAAEAAKAKQDAAPAPATEVVPTL